MKDWSRRYPWIVVATLVAVFFGLFVWSLFSQTTAELCGKDEFTGAKQCASHHLGPFLLMWALDVIDLHNGLVAAVASATIATFTFALWRSTDKLWAAGERQLVHFEATAARELRAYVLVEEARIEHVGPNEHPVAIIKLKNFGQTPAYALKQAAIVGYFKYPLTQPLPQLLGTDDPEMVLGPGGTYTAQPSLNTEVLTLSKIAAINSGSHALFVGGEITYRDCFDQPRQTKYLLLSGAGKVELGSVSVIRAEAT